MIRDSSLPPSYYPPSRPPYNPQAIIRIPGYQPAFPEDFEPNSAAAYVVAHGLPASDAQYIYQYGRQDLRDEIRGFMLTELIQIVNKSPSARTYEEQNIYGALTDIVAERELQTYRIANQQYQSFEKDACDYNEDTQVADQLGVSYDFTLYCNRGVLNETFSNLPVPSQAYFVALGEKAAYSSSLSTAATLSLARAQEAFLRNTFLLNQNAVSAQSSYAAYEAGAGAGAPAAAVGVAFDDIAPFRFSQYFQQTPGAIQSVGRAAGEVFSRGAVTGAEAAINEVQAVARPVEAAATAGAEDTSIVLGAASTAGAVVGIALFAIEAAVTVGLADISNSQAEKDDAQLPALALQAENNRPDLTQMIGSSDGLFRISSAFIQATYPDVPSTTPLPAPTTTQNFFIHVLTGGGNTSAGQLNYVDPQNTPWSAALWNGWLVQTGTAPTGTEPISFGLDIHYIDSVTGVSKVATRIAPNFWEVENTVYDSNEDFCPINPVTGITSIGTYKLSTCQSYVSSSIDLLSSNLTNNAAVSSAAYINQAPTIISPNVVRAATGLPFTSPVAFTESDPDNQIPCVSHISGSAIQNVGYSSANSSFYGVAPYAYPAAASGFNLNVTCGLFTTSQPLSFTSGTSISLASSTHLIALADQPFSATLVTHSAPIATLSLTHDALPPGLSFKDNGDGTATISGTPTGSLYSCTDGVFCTTLNATTQFASLSQVLDIQVQRPYATLTSPATGSVVKVTNDGTNQVIPVTFSQGNGVQLTGTTLTSSPSLTFQNNGDGTGQFTYNSLQASPVNLTATINVNNFGQTYSQSFTIQGTGPKPAVTSLEASPLAWVVGAANDSSPKAIVSNLPNGLPLIPLFQSQLPAGVTISTLDVGQFDPLNPFSGTSSAIVFNGAPQPGSGGLYHLPVIVQSAYGPDTHTATIDLAVYEAPVFPIYDGANTVFFHLGQASTFKVRPISGFPILPFASTSLGVGSSSGLNYALDSSFTGGALTSTPFSLVAPTGQASLLVVYDGGSPTTTGPDFYLPLDTQVTTGPVPTSSGGTVTAVPYTATGTLSLHVRVLPAGDANGDGKVDCTDFSLVRSLIGTTRTSPTYQSSADLNGDGKIDARDLILLTRNLTSTTCH